MTQKTRAWTRRPFLWVVCVAGLALAVGYAATAVLEAGEGLPDDIVLALEPADRGTEAGDLIIICSFVPTDVTRGVQLGLLGFLFGGVPAALLAGVLKSRRHTLEKLWSGDREQLFRAGFVFQLISLLFTAFLLAVQLWVAYDAAVTGRTFVSYIGPLLLGVLCGIWGLGSWRTLQLGVRQTTPTILGV